MKRSMETKMLPQAEQDAAKTATGIISDPSKNPIPDESNSSPPISSIDASGAGAALARLEKFISRLESTQLTAANPAQAAAYLYYSLVQAASRILNSKEFNRALKEASLIDMLKGLEIILARLKDVIGIPEGLLTPANTVRNSDLREIRTKITQMEEIRKEVRSQATNVQ